MGGKEHPPANRFWHQGFGRVELLGKEIVVFVNLESMLSALARSMLSGFIVEPVSIDYGDGEDLLYGFRQVPKSQLQKKKTRPHYKMRTSLRMR